MGNVAIEYQEFLDSKRVCVTPSGFDVPRRSINPKLYDFQGDIVRWGIRKGKCAFFEDCGLGKTGQQIEWGQQIYDHAKANGNVIVFAPLAVSRQTCGEGRFFGIPVTICREKSDVRAGCQRHKLRDDREIRPLAIPCRCDR